MLANLSGRQQQPHTEAIHANVVADRRKVLYAFAYQSTNEVLRNSAQPKPTHHDGGAIENVLNCLVRATDDLIHRKRNSKGNSSRKQLTKQSIPGASVFAWRDLLQFMRALDFLF